MKKIIIILCLLMPLIGKAQLAVGDWKVFPILYNPGEIIDTKAKVYYLSSEGFLFSYDKESGESEGYTNRNGLNDINISGIYYNHAKNYLMITYSNSNIDIMYDNGTIKNIPDVKNAIITSSKTINDVNFYGNDIYVATEFGYLVINSDKLEISESHLYYKAISGIGVVGDYLLICQNSKVYGSLVKSNHSTIDTFSDMNMSMAVKNIMAIDNAKFLCIGAGKLYTCAIDNATSIINSILVDKTILQAQTTADGFLAQWSNGYSIISSAGTISSTIAMPAAISGALVSTTETDGSLWAFTLKGIQQYKFDGTTFTAYTEPFKYDASVVDFPYHLIWKNDKLYVLNSGLNNTRTANYGNVGRVNIYSANVWTDVTPDEVPSTNANWGRNILSDPSRPVFSPNEENTYFLGSWYEGVYKITDNKVTAHYDYTNSPYKINWNCFVGGLQFDKDGNLWTIFKRSSDYENSICILPKEAQLKSTVTAADWKTMSIQEISGDPYFEFYMPEKSDYKWYMRVTSGMIVIDNGGTIDDTSDDKSRFFSSFYDQDEKSFSPGYFICMSEDNNGKLWVGTDDGVFEISSPKTAFNTNFRINRLKVPRNDGTSYADYLLENQFVHTIVTDPANRKWIGTRESGIYLVSADGSEILKHFTTDNSYLPDNSVISICLNATNNEVYIGTPKGICVYSSDATPSEDNYNNVLAYPNPVRPEYEGWITIKGLKESSLVKITDAAGNLVYQGVSTGGMLLWDGRNANGKRVKTGVYFVLASEGASGGKSAVATKILVVN